MRAFLFAMLVLSGAWSQATAQVNEQPNIILTIFAGAQTGHALWSIAKQPLLVMNSNPTQYDTIGLNQSIGSSIIVGASATYFPSPHVGVHLELSYLGLPVDAGCDSVFFQPDIDRKNAQTCDDIRQRASDGGAIAIFGGVTLRAASRRAISPYARLDLGFVNESRSTIEVVGQYVDASGPHVQEVISDPQPRRTAALLGAAIGFTRAISPGYQFRWEGRDLLVEQARLTGPATTPLPAGGFTGPITSRLYHHFSMILALDVVLEKKRGRRY
jgi:hypothetical protein